ncbi:MAG: glycosyltransferase [Pseudomonadales bacterium]
MTIKALFIGIVWPEPDSSAAGTRTIQLLQAGVAAGWDICFAATAQPGDFSADLTSLGVRSHGITLNDSSFDRFIAAEQPDLVLFDRFMAEEQFAMRVAEQCPDAVRILDTSDLHFLRRARMTAFEKNAPLDLHTDDMRREIAAILRCDLSLVVSEFETQLLRTQLQVPITQLHYCPFMLPAPEPATALPSFDERRDFVMIGNFLHKPNVDAVRWASRELWPQIKAVLPDARCDVFGAHARDVDRQLSRPELDLCVRGRASGARECLAQYRVNLATLRYGAGIKGKIADGFLAGTPCIATAVAAEAMAGDLPWGGSIADSASEIVSAAKNLYTNPAHWAAAQEHGFEIIRQRFAATAHRPALIDRLSHILADPASHRRQNVIGSVVMQQQLRSTYYMSKWIEDKQARLRSKGSE